MAKKQNVHVVPNGNMWQVKPAGSAPVSNHRTQAAALAAAKPLAQARRSEVVTHRPDGTIRDGDSYGNDPRSIRDTKH